LSSVVCPVSWMILLTVVQGHAFDLAPDVWSAGCVIYGMVIWTEAWAGYNQDHLIYMIGKFPWGPGTPNSCQRNDTCFEAGREARASASELIVNFVNILYILYYYLVNY